MGPSSAPNRAPCQLMMVVVLHLELFRTLYRSCAKSLEIQPVAASAASANLGRRPLPWRSCWRTPWVGRAEHLTQTTCGLWARAPPLALATTPQAYSRRCDESNVTSDPDPASSQGIRLRVLIVAGTVESGLRIGSGAKTWGQARVRDLGSSRADLSHSGRRVMDLRSCNHTCY